MSNLSGYCAGGLKVKRETRIKDGGREVEIRYLVSDDGGRIWTVPTDDQWATLASLGLQTALTRLEYVNDDIAKVFA